MRPHRVARRLSLALPALFLLFAAVPTTAQTVGEAELVGAMLDVGTETYEPTIGADPEGNLYFAKARIAGMHEVTKAGMYRSTDGGATWTDISPNVAGIHLPPQTSDPFIYVDPTTGRAFNFHMFPILTCSILSWTDDGGGSWTTNPAGCFPTVIWDHQNMVAAAPRVLTPSGYPNILLQCVNAVYAIQCSRSLDGGLTWMPPEAVTGNCQRLGHLASAPDGTTYLPTPCGGVPNVFVSRDDGMTWTRRVVSDMEIPATDPAVDVDEEGNVYAAWVDHGGDLFFSVSRDLGATWTDPVLAAPGITATMPEIAVGDPGRIAIAYPGTDDLAEGFDTNPRPPHSEFAWGAYFTASFDALSESPTFDSVLASGTDPLERGDSCESGWRCTYQFDFIDVIIAPDGRPYASFADGCTAGCATDPNAQNNEVATGGNTGDGVVATITQSPMLWCETRCARYGSGSSEEGER